MGEVGNRGSEDGVRLRAMAGSDDTVSDDGDGVNGRRR